MEDKNLFTLTENVCIKLDSSTTLEGTLTSPRNPIGIILFAYGVGSSRFSPKYIYLSQIFRSIGFSTLVFDLLTANEERLDYITGEFRFNLSFLSNRITGATQWIQNYPSTANLPIGFFGCSAGASGALLSSINSQLRDRQIFAIISQSGRTDLISNQQLKMIKTPTLLIAGGEDSEGLEQNRSALLQMSMCNDKDLIIIPYTSHLYTDPACLEQIAEISKSFFIKQLDRFKQQQLQHQVQQTQKSKQCHYYNNFTVDKQQQQKLQQIEDTPKELNHSLGDDGLGPITSSTSLTVSISSPSFLTCSPPLTLPTSLKSLSGKSQNTQNNSMNNLKPKRNHIFNNTQFSISVEESPSEYQNNSNNNNNTNNSNGKQRSTIISSNSSNNNNNNNMISNYNPPNNIKPIPLGTIPQQHPHHHNIQLPNYNFLHSTMGNSSSKSPLSHSQQATSTTVAASAGAAPLTMSASQQPKPTLSRHNNNTNNNNNNIGVASQ